MSVTVSIDNLPEVQKFIRESGDKMTKSLGRIMRDASLVCMDYAKQIAPVRTGRYRSSIHLESPSKSDYRYSDNKGRSFDGGFSEKPADDEIFVGTNVEYAGFLEEGTKRMGARNIMRRGAEKAQFYIITKINELTR